MTKAELDEIIRTYGEVKEADISIKISRQTQEYARELVSKMKEAERVKQYLTELHIRINELSMRVLPDLFHEQDLSIIGVANGVMLELTPYFKASLPIGMDPAKREKALEYLREKAPEIVETNISFSYGRHKHELAEQTIDVFHELGLDPKVFEGVHHATLTAWVKEQFLSGREVPTQTLNAKIGSVVKIHMSRAEDAEILKRLRKIQNDAVGLDADSAATTERTEGT